MPTYAYAASSYAPAVSDVSSLLDFVNFIMGALLPIFIGLAVIYFIWSLLTFLLKSGSDKDEARSHMIWGIVIIFVMVSIWGLVNVLKSSLSDSAAPTNLEDTLLPS